VRSLIPDAGGGAIGLVLSESGYGVSFQEMGTARLQSRSRPHA